MSIEGKQTQDGMEPEDDEALWRLLGRARTPEAGPYFSRRVLREVAQAEGSPRAGAGIGGWLTRWRTAWRRPGAAVWPGAVAVAGFWLAVVLTTPSSTPGGVTFHARPEPVTSVAEPVAVPAAEDVVAPQDVEVIADLDNVITREENRLWAEDTTASE